MMEFFVSYLKLLMRWKGSNEPLGKKTGGWVDRTPKLVMEREPNSIR
jgi:hypothetical protein